MKSGRDRSLESLNMLKEKGLTSCIASYAILCTGYTGFMEAYRMHPVNFYIIWES